MSRSSGAPTPLSFGKAGRSLKRRKMRLPHSLAWQLPNSPELCSRTFPGCRDGLSQSNDSLDHQRLRWRQYPRPRYFWPPRRSGDRKGPEQRLSSMVLFPAGGCGRGRSEEHTSELQSLMRISYAVFCLKKKNKMMKYINTNKRNTRVQKKN